jgi:hypothetical protein
MAFTFIMLGFVVYFFILPTLKNRVVAVNKIFIMPGIFLYFFFSSIMEIFHWSNSTIYLIVPGIAAGVLAGILLRIPTAITADRARRQIAMPGSYLNLGIFLLIFGVHFILGYLQAVNPDWILTMPVEKNIMLLILAFASTVNSGMSICLFYKYLRAEKSPAWADSLMPE